MHAHKRHILIFLFIVIGLSNIAHAVNYLNLSYEKLLLSLDSILEVQDNLIETKEENLFKLKNELRKSKDNKEKLNVLNKLYEEYYVYDPDSALLYTSKAYSLAKSAFPEDYDLISNLILNRAFVYTVQGKFTEAYSLLDSIDSKRLSPDIRSKFYQQKEYTHSMMSVYVASDKAEWKEVLSKSNQYRDSILKTNPNPGDDWAWVPVALKVDEIDRPADFKFNPDDKDAARLRKVLETNPYPSRKNAINAYWLSRFYKEIGNNAEMMKFLTVAAIYDALLVNREIAAIQELATILFEKGDLKRAHDYLIYGINEANTYHNRSRMVSLSDLIPSVRDAYQQEIDKKDRRMHTMLIILIIVSSILFLSLIFILFEFRKLNKTNNKLEIANAMLDKALESNKKALNDLKNANSELQDSDRQKLGLLGYAFKLNSDFINSMENYRKKLLKKYKGKQIDDLGTLINDPELVNEQYQDFYNNFDSTILSIFPDFISEYNASVAEADRVDEKSYSTVGHLNTKLRIHALRRLGMKKSSDIAGMLNISVRTVYNNRTDLPNQDSTTN